jgi:hypothetical protein
MRWIKVTSKLVTLAVTLGAAAAGLPGAAPAAQAASAGEELVAPIYKVTRKGVSQDAAERLAKELGLQVNPRAADGSLRYMDPERFQAVPMKPAEFEQGNEDERKIEAQAFDFEALKAMPVLPRDEAMARGLRALEGAGLIPRSASATTGHTTFRAVVDREQVITKKLDTQVNYNFRLGNLPLIGPGAKVKIAFDGRGEVTQLNYATYGVAKAGTVPIVAPELAEKNCFVGQDKDDIEVDTKLVYFAPALKLRTVQALLPHYVCIGSALIEGQTVRLRGSLVPAVESAPRIELDAHTDGEVVDAEAVVRGGTAPYRYLWSSSSTSLDSKQSTAGPSLHYQRSPKDPEAASSETVGLVVTDANGLTAVATRTMQTVHAAPASVAAPAAAASPSTIDVGTEWIGLSQGLGGSAGNAAGFVNRFGSEGIPVRFNWGDFNAWEQDFKDPSLGGDDSNWVDNVDLTFYTGHANGDGFTFPGNMDDGFLHYNDARWGDLDSEWIAIAACGPLQQTEGGLNVFDRWDSAFQGLHMLTGYANVSFDNTDEGRLFSNYMLRTPFLWWNHPMKVREAWVQMAVDVQPSSVTWGYMGPIGPGGVSNFNDYFWGKGSVGPDLRGSDIRGFYVVRGPS